MAHKPIFLDNYPRNMTVKEGKDATLECRFTSEIEPTFMWLRIVHGVNGSEPSEKVLQVSRLLSLSVVIYLKKIRLTARR